MQPPAQHPGLQGWQRLAGTWATEATHPALPGTVVTGQATFEWLEDQRFLIWRSHYDHPEIPDAVAVTGIIDGKPSMHYFDRRGVHRIFEADITAGSPARPESAGAVLLPVRIDIVLDQRLGTRRPWRGGGDADGPPANGGAPLFASTSIWDCWALAASGVSS